MSNKNKKQKHTEPGGKIRQSITNKLNSKLFLRMLAMFISFNILLLIIACVCVAIYSDQRVVNALELLGSHEPPALTQWDGVTDLRIRTLDEPSIHSSSNLRWITNRLSYEPEFVYRAFRADADGFRGTIRSISYVVNIGHNGQIFEVSVQIGAVLLIIFYAFIVLLVFEILTVFSRTINDRKMIRKSLAPITELSRLAQTLGDASRQLDPEKITALAGSLDGIDAAQLDTRIQVDELQDELKNVAIAINSMLDRINESYAAQARFVSDASHELRTPIAVIQGYVNLLDRWGTTDEKALLESVAAIKDEAENMKGLVEQLLFLARGDSNRINMVPEHFDLRALAQEVVSETRLIDDTHEFILNVDETPVMADKGLLKQALRILIDNAIKYTDKDGEITVSTSTVENTARLTVSDSGIGINPDALPNVFNRFVRADESRTRATGGAGLGLSIAEWIVTRHNGHMELLSREDIGTKITLVLPAV
ncbi:MAG: HAMP domain-containing histidine kinase [Oscillospiraceae bacterium]|nr:HAMP domain-containing histidine kinase [Oscillospiraceae bacterium]